MLPCCEEKFSEDYEITGPDKHVTQTVHSPQPQVHHRIKRSDKGRNTQAHSFYFPGPLLGGEGGSSVVNNGSYAAPLKPTESRKDLPSCPALCCFQLSRPPGLFWPSGHCSDSGNLADPAGLAVTPQGCGYHLLHHLCLHLMPAFSPSGKCWFCMVARVESLSAGAAQGRISNVSPSTGHGSGSFH